MNNLWLLIRVQLSSLFTKSYKKSKKKYAIGISTGVSIAACLMYMSVIYTLGMVESFPEGYRYMALYIMGLITIFMLLIFGYQSAQGHLFGFKDYDLLMALPIRKSDVLLSKFLSFLFLEYFYGFFLFAPSIFIVGIEENVGILYYFMGILSLFILPIIPMVIASLLAYLSMLFSGKFKHKSLMNNLFYIFFMFVVITLVFSYQILLNQNATNLIELLNRFRTYLPFMTLLIDGMIETNILKFIVGFGMNLVVFVFFNYGFAKQFMSVNGQIQSGYKVKNYKLRKSKSKSIDAALFYKELKTYFSTTIYFVNTAVMPILTIGGLLYFVFFESEEIQIITNVFHEMVFPIVSGGIFMLILMSCTTNSSISLEKNQFNLLKSYPIDPMRIFMSKIRVNLLLVYSFGILISILAKFVFQLSWIDFGLCLLTTLSSGFFISAFGLILNLHFYRFDWENVASVVKQSLPTFITTVGGMVVGGGFIGLGIRLMEFISAQWLIFIFNILLLGIDICFYSYLKHGGKKQWNKIHE